MDKLLVRHSPLALSSCLLRRSSRPALSSAQKKKQNRSILSPRSPSILAPRSRILRGAPSHFRLLGAPLRSSFSAPPSRSSSAQSPPLSSSSSPRSRILRIAPSRIRLLGRRAPPHPPRRPAPRSSSWAAHQPTFARTRILLGTCVEPSPTEPRRPCDALLPARQPCMYVVTASSGIITTTKLEWALPPPATRAKQLLNPSNPDAPINRW
ncbi:hypothetical protein SORBI_3010G143633 [Sorghum bicolor]|uniref:Uncharacterized protein n=1 Tax=Sorghum bicolor TaxID=4558 RepID=A0A1W0VT27_SORBI|nr:hypothetical protein SORBI_3010G143633 [Sorghum bicolor]